MRPPRHHPWLGGEPPPLPPRRELTEAVLDEDKPRPRVHLRPCGCAKAGPHVVGRCRLAPPGEAVQLATTCVACGYAIVRGRCGRCHTVAAEVAS